MKKRCSYFWVSLLVVAGWATAQLGWGQSETPPAAVEPAREKPVPPPAVREERLLGMLPREGGPKGEPRERGDWRPGLGPGPGPEGERFGGDRDRRGSGGGKGMGGPPMWGGGFERLSEEQKRRVREALGKAWGRPEVAEARERMMEANEAMRRVIHEALLEIDPEIAKILATMHGGEGHGGRGEPPQLPPVESPHFPEAAIKRLEMELLVFSPPERREETRQLLTRVQERPQIQEGVKRLKAAPIGERLRGMEDLRKLYREAVGEELKAFRGRSREPGVKRPPTMEAPAESPVAKPETAIQ